MKHVAARETHLGFEPSRPWLSSDGHHFTGHRRQPAPLLLLLVATMAGDTLALLASGLGASALLSQFDAAAGPAGDLGPRMLVALAATAFAGHVLQRSGTYSSASLLRRHGRKARYLAGVLAGVLPALLCIALVPDNRSMFPLWPVLWIALSLLSISAGHMILEVFTDRLASSGRLSRKVAVVGVNALSASILAQADCDRSDRVEVVGCFRDGEDGLEAEHPGSPVLGGLADVLEHGRLGLVDAVVLAIPLSEPERISRATRALATMVADIYVATGPAELPFGAAEVQHITAMPMVRVRQRPLDPWQALHKNLFDRAAACLLLVALSPVLLISALLIKLDSAGPVLFRQPRLGFNGVMFPIYKFRTMHHASADLMADRQTTRDDARITRVGRMLRRLSLDELPQLLNVLNGSMSLVGPRPHAPNTKAGDTLFHDAVEEYALRHRVKPGITGWAQVNGWRGETRTLEQLQQRVAHDLAYIENWSLLLDLRIIYMTVRSEITSKSAF